MSKHQSSTTRGLKCVCLGTCAISRMCDKLTFWRRDLRSRWRPWRRGGHSGRCPPPGQTSGSCTWGRSWCALVPPGTCRLSCQSAGKGVGTHSGQRKGAQWVHSESVVLDRNIVLRTAHYILYTIPPLFRTFWSKVALHEVQQLINSLEEHLQSPEVTIVNIHTHNPLHEEPGGGDWVGCT